MKTEEKMIRCLGTRRYSALPAWLCAWVLAVPALGCDAAGSNDAGRVSFQVRLDASVAEEPVSGRLVVYLIRDGAKLWPTAQPSDGPFFRDPQPMFGIDVDGLAPGAVATVDDRADCFPVAPSRLPAGTYRAAAVLDRNRKDSQWRREPGNLFSKTVPLTVGKTDAAVVTPLVLSQMVSPHAAKSDGRVAFFEIKSRLLSDFRHEKVMHRAGVVLPIDHDPAHRYPAIYSIPGFGGNHQDAAFLARGLARSDADSPRGILARHVVYILLDPEGPNGHHLFADSANNGPVGRALIEELIPALEKEFNLIPKASARIVTGHSSGGWSSLWLATMYPKTFGACWSSAPDPIDFRAFQQTDVYAGVNFYTDPKDGTDLASFRSDGAGRMTVREETRMEEVLGPNNTSAQQWDSWHAAFGPRGADGLPAALFDVSSGRIDKQIAAAYRKYDISHRLSTDPRAMIPIFKNRVHLVVGDRDSFYLNRAVKLLKTRLASFPPADRGSASNTGKSSGYIKIVEGATHGSVLRSPAVRQAGSEMVEHLRGHGHIPK